MSRKAACDSGGGLALSAPEQGSLALRRRGVQRFFAHYRSLHETTDGPTLLFECFDNGVVLIVPRYTNLRDLRIFEPCEKQNESGESASGCFICDAYCHIDEVWVADAWSLSSAFTSRLRMGARALLDISHKGWQNFAQWLCLDSVQRAPLRNGGSAQTAHCTSAVTSFRTRSGTS